ncbi:DUF2510 domain-containing protein [Mycolicibacterium doricum]|nr:DUF2510 domain-containing protein [Mycolicibacterium doricum]
MKTPAGWYPNPDGSPSERYWDGGRWTNDQRTPRTSAPGAHTRYSDPPHARVNHHPRTQAIHT